MPIVFAAAFLLLGFVSPHGRSADLSISTDFPGGSAAVELIDQEKRIVKLMPADHPNRGWRCWWYFRLDGLEPGETVTLDVGERPWATPDRATFSDDAGKTWKHTEPGERHDKRIEYRFAATTDEPVWFAWGPPFLLDDARKLIQSASKKGGGWAVPFILTRSRGGHEVPSIRIAETKTPDTAIWIQARQHAWESGSSWVCRGLLEWLVSMEARDLRSRAEIVVTPIMDADNVQRGAGGKNQNPWDHNRDWREEPHWPEIVAAQEGIRRMHDTGRFRLFVDLHNPGAGDRDAYFYIPPRDRLSAEGLKNLTSFTREVEKTMTGPIPFKGRLIESGAKYDTKNWRYISKNWVAEYTGGSVVAVTLETGWNTPGSHTEGYRAVGRQLGEAIQQYVAQLAGSQEN